MHSEKLKFIWLFSRFLVTLQKNNTMKYRIKKETKPTLPTFGKYKAVAVHHQTIDSRMIVKEAARNSTFDEGDIIGVLMRVSEVVNSHLRRGDRVRLPEWGMMKLEIESDKVDNPRSFRASKHIRGVRLHFIPESVEGTQNLYAGITFEKDKTVYAEAQVPTE
jgi:predicted histone-like DNA-binding protein